MHANKMDKVKEKEEYVKRIATDEENEELFLILFELLLLSTPLEPTSGGNEVIKLELLSK